MKKVFLTLVFLVILTAVFAQTMNEMVVVKQAVIRPDQLVNHARKDRMGRVCAGLMIYTDLTGLSFDSNNGVVDLTQQPGSYMVFVSEGERVLYIYKEGFKPLEIILYQYGISGLKSGQVYQIDVTAKDKEASKTQSVVFNVTPADAVIRVGSEVFVSGQAKSLPLGDNEVIIEKEGYRSIKDNIKVSSTNILFTYTLQKTEPVLTKIRTNPADAIIYINNAERGNSPRDLWLFPGMYELKINKSQYLTLDEVITISENKENEFSYNLTKNTGVINFTVSPQNAELLINNQRMENKTFHELAPGVYEVEVRADQYLTKNETIDLKIGDRLNKTYNLIKNTGVINFTISPQNAELYINNQKMDNNTFQELAPGTYITEVKAHNYFSQSETIEIKLGDRLSKLLELKKSTGEIKFRGNPVKAELYINNKLADHKLIHELVPGNYNIEIKAHNYFSINEIIEIKLNDKLDKQYNLTKNTGVVNFTLNPANAQVFVNRELASNSNRLELVPGVYMIEIKADKHHSQTETIEVKLGDNIRKNYTLQAMKGTLLLTVNPVDTKTELYLDNKL
ncbi:MAG: PEGA domain-containing protein, partial [Candidatus Cloacimonetes bacterium]|nr:PEGA domain-containing protein [Candidatus Cloacimonadota bacterium]